jgi:transposase-like protein
MRARLSDSAPPVPSASRNVHALIATGVNADGHREILGLDVTSSEDGAGWLAFLRGLAARGRHRTGVVQGLQALYPRDGSA